MREFLLIAMAAFASSIAGGIFGSFIGWLSPELIRVLAQPQQVLEPVRFGAATGLIAGLLIGAAAMGFGQFVGVLRARTRRPVDKEDVPDRANSMDPDALGSFEVTNAPWRPSD